MGAVHANVARSVENLVSACAYAEHAADRRDVHGLAHDHAVPGPLTLLQPDDLRAAWVAPQCRARTWPLGEGDGGSTAGSEGTCEKSGCCLREHAWPPSLRSYSHDPTPLSYS